MAEPETPILPRPWFQSMGQGTAKAVDVTISAQVQHFPIYFQARAETHRHRHAHAVHPCNVTVISESHLI